MATSENAFFSGEEESSRLFSELQRQKAACAATFSSNLSASHLRSASKLEESQILNLPERLYLWDLRTPTCAVNQSTQACSHTGFRLLRCNTSQERTLDTHRLRTPIYAG